MRTSSDVFIFNLGLLFEGLFYERYILKGQIAFERIEDFNLEYCSPLPSKGLGDST